MMLMVRHVNRIYFKRNFFYFHNVTSFTRVPVTKIVEYEINNIHRRFASSFGIWTIKEAQGPGLGIDFNHLCGKVSEWSKMG
jgi:hypothetical protein